MEREDSEGSMKGRGGRAAEHQSREREIKGLGENLWIKMS